MTTEQTLEEDQEQLNLLAIFHYIIGGIAALVSCVPVIHLVIGIFLVAAGSSELEAKGEEVPVALGWLFVIVPVCIILVGLSISICILMAGRNLQRHKAHTFCFTVAVLECLFFPLGTVLGVFTIIVLNRFSVKALFQSNHADDRSAAEDFDSRIA